MPNPIRPARPWGRWAGALLASVVLVGLWFRLRGLGAEGFADDEVHKWLAAQRYLAGAFGGDDLEHPMLMKMLIACAARIAGGRLGPEVLTRLPSAVAGAFTVLATALLGRRLFGRTTGLLAAALVAVSTTAIGYHRIAKEDGLLGLFLTLCLWCLAEALAAAREGRAPHQRRWELAAAIALGAAFASKYFLFYALIPPLVVAWEGLGYGWRISPRRWALLAAVAMFAFLALNWALLLPGSLDYLVRYVRGEHLGGDRSVSESLLFMGRLYDNLPFGQRSTPAWFFAVFALVKFTPGTALLGCAGLLVILVRRGPGDRLLLVWLGIFTLAFAVGGGKYARYFASVLPAFLLLAALGLQHLLEWALGHAARHRLVAAIAGIALTVAPEAAIALAHAPHHRLYVSGLAGGDQAVEWYFPHCDLYDVGVREALLEIALAAEPGAEVQSEVSWTVRYYAAELGRSDLGAAPIDPAGRCPADRTCYVIAQPGRVYRHNVMAMTYLEATVPMDVERVDGLEVVRVYRVAGGGGPGSAQSPARGTSPARGAPPRAASL